MSQPEDQKNTDDTDPGKQAARMERAREEMQAAVGSKDYPRLAMAYEIAVLKYQYAGLFKLFEDTANRNGILYDEVRQYRKSAETLIEYINTLPSRMQLLEGAYAHLQLAAQGNSYVDKLVKAYEMGKLSNNVATNPQEN